MSKEIIEKIIKKYQINKNFYLGEKVTITEHMIQTAMLAEKDKSPKSLICACLLHDIGHFIVKDPDLLVSNSVDGKHEITAYNFLNKYFVKEVTEPIKQHVQAKRYLCMDENYYKNLSIASKISLKLQGGKMNRDEEKLFTLQKYSEESIKLRKYDDQGKIPDFKIKNINEYKKLISDHLPKLIKMKFDYLIIGAGSAGCVLANRLSENTNKTVALFEAGKSSDIWKVNMPIALLYTMHDTKYNWKYYSQPEKQLNNRKLFCPRGKMIGGCSAHNGMVFIRGNPSDYQRWASYGLPSWSYKNVLPYFKKN